MPLGIVSDKDFELEKNKLIPESSIQSNDNDNKNSIVDIIEPRASAGRGHNPNVPNTLRKVIGEESVINGKASALELSRQFGIGPASTTAYTRGSTSPSSYDRQPNLDHINSAKGRIAIKARKKLNLALNALSEDKLNESKAREISGVARDMSIIVKNMEPDLPKSEPNSGPTFVIYSPNSKSEDDYGVLKLKE